MSFFQASFKDFGETLRTVSLVIGLLVTSTTGVSYVYTLISDQKAMAIELDDVTRRIGAIEADGPTRAVNRKRLDLVEENVKTLNVKVDGIKEFLTDFRAEVARKLH